MKKAKRQIPLWLDDLAKKYWKQMSEDVNLDDKYLYETFAQYCAYLSEYRRAVDQMDREGMTVQGERCVKIHPCLNVKNQAQVHIQRLSKVLFTPQKNASHIPNTALAEFME